MKPREPQLRLERRLGYQFRDPEHLARALTHRSAAAANNERLEFLGDALINFVAGEIVYRTYPDAGEGDLSRLRASLVCEEALARMAERLDLSDALVLGAGVLRGGGFRSAGLLADALEAVFGAIYLDGGFAAAREVCERLMREPVAELPEASRLKDPKTRLQEHLQGRGRPLPVYEVQSAEGPPHQQRFTVECRLADSRERTEGAGASRRAAEQDAAEKMIARLQEADHA